MWWVEALCLDLRGLGLHDSQLKIWHGGNGFLERGKKSQSITPSVRITACAVVPQVGGLGDVVTGLARACLERGHSVEVMLPFYECLPQDQIEDLEHDCDFDCPKVSRAPVWGAKTLNHKALKAATLKPKSSTWSTTATSLPQGQQSASLGV